MSFNLNEKIEFLNGLVGGTLTFTHYVGWQLASYGEDTLFCYQSLIGHVYAGDLAECVDKALKLVKEVVANG